MNIKCNSSFCCNENFVSSFAPKENTKIMIIGEAPGRSEVVYKQPFCGAAGKKLNEILLNAGINRQQCYITNAVKCRPENNRKPSQKEIEECSSNFLKEEIINIKPKLIICFGKSALSALIYVLLLDNIPKDNFLVNCFKLYSKKNYNVLILPHPAFFLYRENPIQEEKCSIAIKESIAKLSVI